MKKAYMEDCPVYLNDFLINLKIIRDRADRTEEAYYIDLRTFLRFLKLRNGDVPADTAYGDIRIADVSLALVERFTLTDAYQYLRYLKDERGNSTATRARKTSALKQFFLYLNKKAMLIAKNPVAELELPRVKNKLPKFLSLEESLTLLQNNGSSHPARDYCILTFFLNCGMRLSELVGINLGDISRENRTLRLFGKGSKERIVYINDACIAALDAYLPERAALVKHSAGQNALFVSQKFNRISRRRVQEIVESSLAAAGLGNTGVTTHKLRHTAATLMYQHGGTDTLVLKEILGHKSLATTEIYTHLSSESMKKAADSSPLANVKNLTSEKKGGEPESGGNSSNEDGCQ
ncbi:MAG: tyrosine-type recombinase/integrase [Oscillospiraceae bacterium]